MDVSLLLMCVVVYYQHVINTELPDSQIRGISLVVTGYADCMDGMADYTVGSYRVCRLYE